MNSDLVQMIIDVISKTDSFDFSKTASRPLQIGDERDKQLTFSGRRLGAVPGRAPRESRGPGA